MTKCWHQLVIMSLLLISTSLQARNLGTMGDVYTIRENDLIELIQTRIRTIQDTGQWQTIQNAMQRNAANYRDRPQRVASITKATETKSWSFDPSITLGRDVFSPDGKKLAVAGTRINPLVSVKLSKTLIFLDGDDTEQVQWTMHQITSLKGRVKLILVNGSLLNLEKIFHLPVFFDQAGRLTKHFNVQHVPAEVQQSGLSLKITEYKL